VKALAPTLKATLWDTEGCKEAVETFRLPANSAIAKIERTAGRQPKIPNMHLKDQIRFMPSRVLYFAVFVLLGPAMCSSAGHPPQTETDSASPPHPADSTTRQGELDGIPNFSEVSATLYRGGQPTNRGFDGLAKMGIDIVVDLRGSRENERKEVTRLGMQYIPIPWHCYQPRAVPCFAAGKSRQESLCALPTG
jgi:hypothetical protein